MAMLGWTGPQSLSEGGICTCCGKQVDKLTMVGENEEICDDCLISEYEQCDRCGNYYQLNIIDFYDVDDEHICEYCYVDEEEDEE